MELNSEAAREITKIWLRPYYGDLYDKTIDTLTFERSDFRGNPTFYHAKPDRYHDQKGVYNISKYFIFGIKENNIDINTNIIRTVRFELETGKYWDHNDFTGKSQEIQKPYNYNFNKKLDFETNLVKILADWREKQINSILED